MIPFALPPLTTAPVEELAPPASIQRAWSASQNRRMTASILATFNASGSGQNGGDSGYAPPRANPAQEMISERLSRLRSMHDDWDRQGALRPDQRVIDEVSKILRVALDGVEAPAAPFLVPLADGGVQVEWHAPGQSLEVAFYPGGERFGCLEDESLDAEIEAEGSEATDLLVRHARRFGEAPRHANDVGRAPQEDATVAA